MNADLNFCDEQLVKDLVDRRVAAEKIAAKWVLGFVKSRPIDGEDLNDAQAVKKAQERLKSELPFFCPHYGMFKNNVRRQENRLSLLRL